MVVGQELLVETPEPGKEKPEGCCVHTETLGNAYLDSKVSLVATLAIGSGLAERLRVSGRALRIERSVIEPLRLVTGAKAGH